MKTPLILASTSIYRQQLLQKLNVDFSCISPDIDETPFPNEDAQHLVQRLAKAKALAGASLHQANSNQANGSQTKLTVPTLFIGSDQVAVIDGEIIGKPHTQENAIAQLQRASGKAITFYTGLALYHSGTEQLTVTMVPYTVHFRQLSLAQIIYYVQTEQPLYCAGSFKCEGLGIALFERLEGDDPNTLIGLPLIKLIDMLQAHGETLLS
jgi:MAF protein